MKRNIKTSIALTLLLCLAFTQTGCSYSTELRDLVVVMGIGFDIDTENPDNIKLISQIVLPDKIPTAGSSSAGTNENPYCNIESSAENMFEAVREYTHVTSNKLYIAHNEVIVIGRDVARNGIENYMDFFVRAKETRPATSIVIADKTAAEVLSVKPISNLLPSIYIKKLVKEQVDNSQSMEATILDYLNTMQSKTSSFLAPLVKIERQKEYQIYSIKGMAVFSKDKMVGELNESESRGVLWVKNKIETGVISVSLDSQQVAVEIKSAAASISPEVKGNKVTMNIKIKEESTLAMQTGSKNLATPKNINKIEPLVKEVIRSEIMQAFDKAKTLNVDIFGFGEELQKYCRRDWKKLKNDWQTIFPTMELNIEVEANITGSGVITNPAVTKS